MKLERQKLLSMIAIALFAALTIFLIGGGSIVENAAFAQANPTPTPAAAEFDQNAALAKLKEQIKGKEQEPASTVFKNIQGMKNMPAGRLLAVMEFGYARSLGVTCTHCHVPDKWESEDKPEKQIARDMAVMAAKINGELLKNIKNLKSVSPVVNCTTCHRGQIKPATNLPMPAKS